MVLTVRRFRCVNRLCKRNTFVQDCGPSLPPLAPRTVAANETNLDMARAAGGEGGAPEALQLADHFHLLQSATGALDGMLRGRPLAVEVELPAESTGADGKAAEVQMEEAVSESTISPTKRLLAQRFRVLLKDRGLADLERWMDDARRSDILTFMGLANSLQAAFLLPWSNGQLEGQVNRVKLIKRQGYSKARFDLLRCRVLAA